MSARDEVAALELDVLLQVAGLGTVVKEGVEELDVDATPSVGTVAKKFDGSIDTPRVIGRLAVELVVPDGLPKPKFTGSGFIRSGGMLRKAPSTRTNGQHKRARQTEAGSEEIMLADDSYASMSI